MKKILKTLLFLLLFPLEPLFASSDPNLPADCQIDTSMVAPFYYDGKGSHTYKLIDTQIVEGVFDNQYSVHWYVDTEEWDFAPGEEYIFAKMTFTKGDKEVASFYNDEGWSYIDVVDSKAQMFKVVPLDDKYTALIFVGAPYAAGAPELALFLLSDDGVNVLFNQELAFKNFDGRTLTIRNEHKHFTFDQGQITFFSNQYPSGKTIFRHIN